MHEQDVRWQQRFAGYQKALRQLQGAVELSGQRELSPLEKQGVIHVFEFTHELAWNVLKDYLQDQGLMLFALGVRLTDAPFAAWRIGLVGAVAAPLAGSFGCSRMRVCGQLSGYSATSQIVQY